MPSATPAHASAPASCAHERGPGTSVCLRCRAELHAAAAARLQRTLARVGVAAVVLAVAGGVGGGMITAHHGGPVAFPATPAASTAATAQENVVAQGEPAAPATPAMSPRSPLAAASAPVSSHAIAADSGRTELSDGMYIERSAGVARVHFDTDLSRTRRRDKFEKVVRETLPALYGARADSILATVSEGEVTRGGDLLRELPELGIHLPASGGWAITLWPETRPGRDGPLVVSYRASIAPVR